MRTYTEVMEKLDQVKELWTWKEAVRVFEMNEAEQLLLCALWGFEKESGKEVSKEELWTLLSEIRSHGNFDLENGMPEWIYEKEHQVLVSPVVTAWLNEELPKLPKGVSLVLPKEQTSYDLENILKDAVHIFETVEENDFSAVLCIEGEKGSGKQFCMEQICAKQGLTLLIADGDVFGGTERELNACVLCAKLFGFVALP